MNESEKTKKPGNKWIRRILAITVTVLLLTVLFVNTKVFTDIKVSECVGSGARSMGSLTADTAFQQSFVPGRENLSYIEVRFATYTDNTAPGKVLFSLLDADGRTLVTREAAIKDLVDDEFYSFPVNQTLKAGETYSFTLKVVDNGLYKAPVAWVSLPSGGEETSLVLPGINLEQQYQTNAHYGYTYFNYTSFFASIALILLCGVLIFFRLEIPAKYRPLAGWAALLVTPAAMFFIVESLNDNSALHKIKPAYPLNFIFYLLLYLIVFAIFNNVRISLIAVNTVIYVLAVINHFKLMFRGEPLQPWDIFAVKTAMNVSSSYNLSLSILLIMTFLYFLVLVLVLSKIDYSVRRIRRRVVIGTLSTALSVFLVFSLFGTDRYAVAAFNLMQKIGVVNNVWNQSSNYEKNGLVIAFTMNTQYMNVDKPNHYSYDTVEAIRKDIEQGTSTENILLAANSAAENAFAAVTPTPAGNAAIDPTGTPSDVQPTQEPTQEPTQVPAESVPQESASAITDVLPQAASQESAPAETGALVKDPSVKPNIIAIMCESYADLSCVADFATNQEVTPFYDSISNNVIKGNVYVSTYGGGTANSEFEFLTGNTMAFLPTGSIPYQQYIDAPTGSLAQILDQDGYLTYAVHPYDASGWNRTEVYKNFGFDQFFSQTDFVNPSYMRGYISDSSSYSKLIDLFNSKPEGQPIFLFNVTMQNHGGYTKQYPNFTNDITLTDFPGQYPETEQYLSLIHQSDKALESLITYFSTVDEPTVILFFGDHLPSLKNGFYEQLLGKNLSDLSSEEMLKLYQTPFLLWANYDIKEQSIDKVSANYLSTLLLQTAGLELPDYNQKLSELYQSYPVINSMAVISSDGTVYPSVSSAPENDDFDAYSILQYNNLFDKSRRDATLFDSASPTAAGKGIMITGLPLEDTRTDTALVTSATGAVPALTGSIPSSVPYTVLTPTPAAVQPAA